MKTMVKKIVKILGVFLLVIALACLGGYLYLITAYPSVDPAPDIEVEATEARLKRGKYLVENVAACIDCHSERNFEYFSGPLVKGTAGKGGEPFPDIPGRLYATGITSWHLKDWTDGEIFRAITTGVKKDGTPMFPIMPYRSYGQVSKEDIYSIVAYVKTLPSIENEVPSRQLNFPLNLIVYTIPQPASLMEKTPQPADGLAYGEYLTRMAACADCHTPKEKGQPRPGMDFAGGMKFTLPDGQRVASSNITPHKKTGIGGWTKKRFIQSFKVFDTPLAEKIPAVKGKNTIMPWTVYAGMTEEDLGAIFDYLQSLKPVEHEIDQPSLRTIFEQKLQEKKELSQREKSGKKKE